MEKLKIKTVEPGFCERLFSILPQKYKESYGLLSYEQKQKLTEIRLRAFMPCSFTVAGVNVPMTDSGGECIKSSTFELCEIVSLLCEGSVYSYGEYIKNGYIPFCGTRVGLSGTACVDNGIIRSFNDITSLNIRVPGYIRNAAESVIRYVYENGPENTLGIIAVSPPNCGKTTFLRSFASGISQMKYQQAVMPMRVCIADERQEIYSQKMFEQCICDVISGVPKVKALEIAMRTLSPQVIVCDEIGNEREAEMLYNAYSNGIYLVASVHGNGMSELYRKKYMKALIRAGVFKTAYLLERNGDVISGKIEKMDCPLEEIL